MNLHQLRYFVKLAEIEHYTKAAEELNITQPSLSKAISNLEDELNILLFEKDGRSIKLTKQGKTYYEMISVALNQIDTANNIVSNSTDNKIRIGYVSSLVTEPIPELISKYKEIDDNTFFSLDVATSTKLIDKLKKNVCDIIFCTAMKDSSITFIPLFKQDLVIVCSKSHRFAGRETININELNGEDFINHSSDTGMNSVVREILHEQNTEVNITSEANEDRLLLSLIKNNIGISILTYSDNILDDDVCLIPLVGIKTERYISLGYLKSCTSLPLLRFKDFVLKQYN